MGMYRTAYFDVQKVLDEALGETEDAGAGEGIARDVWLLARQRDHARGLLDEAMSRLLDFDPAAAASLADRARACSADDLLDDQD